MGLSHNIAAARKRMELTQEQLAEKCNVSRQAVTKWEGGESEPTISKLEILSEVLNIGIDELITGRKKDDLNNKSELLPLDYSLISAMANNLVMDPQFLQLETSRLLYFELMYEIIKTKYMDSNGKIYKEYLLENTTQEERTKRVKLLMCERVYAKELFQNYIEGKWEIDIAFDQLRNKIEERFKIASTIEDKRQESQIAEVYRKVCSLLNRMKSFEYHSKKMINGIEQEFQIIINEQEDTLLGRMLRIYLKDVELAWNSRDKEILEEFYCVLHELKPYIWSKIK